MEEGCDLYQQVIREHWEVVVGKGHQAMRTIRMCDKEFESC